MMTAMMVVVHEGDASPKLYGNLWKPTPNILETWAAVFEIPCLRPTSWAKRNLTPMISLQEGSQCHHYHNECWGVRIFSPHIMDIWPVAVQNSCSGIKIHYTWSLAWQRYTWSFCLNIVISLLTLLTPVHNELNLLPVPQCRLHS